MSRSRRPSWYHPGDVPKTIYDAATSADVSTRTIVDVLAREELDAPEARIEAMVEAARDRVTESDEIPTHDLDDPRPLQTRFVDADDVSYLGTSDFATVLGVVLSRYEGTFQTPEVVDDVAVDLFWNRQYTTVGIRAISRPPEAPVDRDDIEPLVEGNTTLAVGRSPSVLGVVSKAGFTSFAREYAEKHDIELFGTYHLTRWFEDARLTHGVLGSLLEGDDLDDEELAKLLDSLPSLPDAIRESDPLGELSDELWSGTDDGRTVETGVKRPIPVPDSRPDAGKTGAMYADPAKDGDYGAFDRFIHELQEEDE